MSTYGPYPAIVDEWHDGDTAHVRLDCGFGIWMHLSCRIYGINAPELSTDAGKAALTYVQGLCPAGTAVKILSHGWDKYGGRFDLGTAMINAGEAVAYYP